MLSGAMDVQAVSIVVVRMVDGVESVISNRRNDGRQVGQGHAEAAATV